MVFSTMIAVVKSQFPGGGGGMVASRPSRWNPPGVLRVKMKEYYIDENFKELPSEIVFHF